MSFKNIDEVGDHDIKQNKPNIACFSSWGES